MAKEKLKSEKIDLATPEEPKLSLETLSDRIDKMVNVLNNIISYCNTVEKWRTMRFQTEEQAKKLSQDAEQAEKS